MSKYTASNPKIKKLVSQLTKWSDSYHNTSKPIVSDATYDKYLGILEKHVPDHPFLKRVGAPIKKAARKAKVKLPYYMPSLDKIYPDKGAEAFLSSSSGQFDVLDKLDGVSALTINEGGELKMYTRGNGSVGQDITPLLPHIKGVGKLNKNEAVRGELLMSLSTFKKTWSEEFDNARNTVSGVANSTKIHKAAKNIVFVAHELVSPSTPWAKARVKLKAAGFNTAHTKSFTNPTIKDFEDHLAERRKVSDFDIDGIVPIDRKTGSKISFKVNAPSILAVVDHVEWNLSKNSTYKPVVVLKKPVKIGGVSVKRASAHNARRVVDLKIGPGAVVEIVRAGDVIPKVEGVTKPAKQPQLPENFKWDAKKVEAIGTNLSKKDKLTVNSKKLTESFRILGVDGIRIGAASVLAKNGYDLVDLFDASEKEIVATGIGNVNSTKLYKGLQKVRKETTHTELMWASQSWPKGFTDTKFNLVLTEVPFDKMVRISEAKLIQVISNIHGFSETSAKVFVKHLPDYVEFLDELGWKPKAPKAIKSGGSLEGMTFVFTKVRNKELETVIKENGGKVGGSISAKTTALITKSLMMHSPKTTKANDLGIPIYTLNQFKQKFGV